MKSTFEFGPYRMRLIKPSDTDAYFKHGFEDISEETKYLTGTTNTFTKEQITSYVKKIVENPARFDFLILEKDQIIGEAVLMDVVDNAGHYRICIFNKRNFSKGIGYSATQAILNFAFGQLKLDLIELEVFPFNDRGIALYRKIGFRKIEGIKDDEAVAPYIDINIMQLKKEDYLIDASSAP